MASGFITRIEREKAEPYTVIFETDDESKYRHIENECRKMIDHKKPQTNADRIRNMTDEELVFFFWGTVDGSGKTVEQWREWLKQECDYENK